MWFGIDLGTTNSLIAVFRDGRPELIPNALGDLMTPSVVAALDGGVVVGDTAREVALRHPADAAACFKRAMGTERGYRLGGREYSAVELSAMVLSSLKADAEAHLGVEVTNVVISVPAYFNELQRRAVRSAGRIAGLTVERLINEPTAAALAYGLHEAEEDERRVLVFDLGGGTFDISVVEFFEGVMEVRASAGDAFLGGEDFTEAILRHVAAQSDLDPHEPATRASLLRLAEAAKRQLSEAAAARILPRVGDKEIDVEITRERFEDIAAQLLGRMSRPLDRALSDAGLSAEQISHLVLVGGATRMPVVRSLAARRARRLPTAGVDPDQVVALGAAVQAALIANDRALKDVVMTDVSAFTLGIETTHRTESGSFPGYFTPIIERNSVVPVSREMIFSAGELGQRAVEIKVLQGESPVARNNLSLGSLSVPVPVNWSRHESVRVRFTYDVSGLLEVEATADATQHVERLVVTKLAGEMSERDVAAALRKMEKLKVAPREDAESRHLRARIEAAYAMARGETRSWLTSALAELDAALDRRDPVRLKQLRTDIHQALDLIEADHVR